MRFLCLFVLHEVFLKQIFSGYSAFWLALTRGNLLLAEHLFDKLIADGGTLNLLDDSDGDSVSEANKKNVLCELMQLPFEVSIFLLLPSN